MKTAFDLEFNPTPAVIRTARDATRIIAPDIPQEKLEDVRLLVSELVTNSIRHGGLGAQDWVRVRVSMGAARIRVEVRDAGHGFDSDVKEPPPSDEPAQSGWGLYLLDRIADRWGIDRRQGTCVWFELDV